MTSDLQRSIDEFTVHSPASSLPIDPETLLLAYRSGIFPMADAREDPDVFWVEPRRRAILPLDGFHCSRSLAKVLKRDHFRVTCNADFAAVIRHCADPRADAQGTWISGRIEASYLALHEQGLAHSIECWHGDALVGGLYGVGFDRVFCGESMFSRMPDGSKVALAWLVAALQRSGAMLLDCQFMTDHLAAMGAVEISQSEYLIRLRAAQRSTLGAALEEGLGDGLGEAAAVGAGFALPAGFAVLLAAAADAEGAGAGATLSSSPGNFIAQSFTQTS